MEWFAGIAVALVAGIVMGFIFNILTGDEDASIEFGVVLAVIAYIGFGLAFEMPEGNFMKIENGRVTETKRQIVLAWNAFPDYIDYQPGAIEADMADVSYYDYGINKAPIVKSLRYKIYYRVRDNDLNQAQLYYDEVVRKKGGDMEKVLKEAGEIVKKELAANPAGDVYGKIRVILKTQLAKQGIELAGIAIFEKE